MQINRYLMGLYPGHVVRTVTTQDIYLDSVSSVPNQEGHKCCIQLCGINLFARVAFRAWPKTGQGKMGPLVTGNLPFFVVWVQGNLGLSGKGRVLGVNFF